MIRTTHGDIGIRAHHAFVSESNLLWIGAYLKGCNFGLSGGVDHINVIAPGIGPPDTPIRAQRQKVRVGSNRNGFDYLIGGGVNHCNSFVTLIAHIGEIAIPRKSQAGRTFSDSYRTHDAEAVGIHY